MQKIPTLFVRDENQRDRVTTDVQPACQWVLDGEGIATIKYDGTNVKVADAALYKRQKPKDRDYDDASYVPCDRANPSDRWAFEAFDAAGDDLLEPPDGIYELIGPKVQGNPQHNPVHALVPVLPPALAMLYEPKLDGPRSFDSLRAYLTEHRIEGIVFHHPDGRLAKIKRRDFGLPWPCAVRT